MMSDFTPYVVMPNKKAAWRTPDFNPNAKTPMQDMVQLPNGQFVTQQQYQLLLQNLTRK